MTARVGAVRVLLRVLGQGESLSRALPEVLRECPEAERPLIQELAYGVLRWHSRLEAIQNRLLERPLRRQDRDLAVLLEIGLYELLYLSSPDYAVVDGTVEAARELRKAWATRLVNGVLRAFLRRRDDLLPEVDRDPVARYAHPRWLLARLRATYPQHWQAVCEAANQRPPMTLRVNRSRIDPEEYRRRLEAAGLAAQPHPWIASALTLERPVDVALLPGFEQGLVSVQDAAAQLAAPLLAPRAGERILDACAAPGGKTAHLLEQTGGSLRLDAVEIDGVRLRRVAETLAREGLSATLIEADAAEPSRWWTGERYDRILLDAPCSATGVIRRHPDIKVHRTEQDVAALVERQATLLAALWPLLRPGGILLYVTCSILADENEDQIAGFLAAQPHARAHPIEAPWGLPRGVGRQILPGEAGTDGFFFARIDKAT